MAKTYLEGKKHEARSDNPVTLAGKPDGFGVWDSGSVRCLTEEFTAEADHAGYEAASGQVAVLPLGTVPAGSRILGAVINIGAKTGATADRVAVGTFDGTTFTPVTETISFTAAAIGAGYAVGLNQAISTEDVDLYLIPYENGDTDDAATVKDGQYISASVQYVTMGSAS